jgi:hypothetical protein
MKTRLLLDDASRLWSVTKTIVPVFVALCLLAAAPCSVNAATYTPIDLGTLPGAAASAGYGINNRGQVVGYS